MNVTAPSETFGVPLPNIDASIAISVLFPLTKFMPFATALSAPKAIVPPSISKNAFFTAS